MRRSPSARIASLGVTQTALAIQKMGWLFREQPTEDYGIDAHVEVVDGQSVEGRLLALQIKSGVSFFNEKAEDGWWFRPDDAHVRYWTNHSLPVAVVLFQPDTERCYWQLINATTLRKSSRGGWKVLVPEHHVLGKGAIESLRAATEGDPYVLRIRDLQLARSWMELLASNKRLVIDIEEWVNKLSGRGSITLGIDNEDGRDPSPLANWDVFLGTSRYSEVIPKLFAWADVFVHEETYDDADHEQYEAECLAIDEEDRFYTEEYAEWAARRPEGLRPYANESGEVDRWRLELTLNDLGKAFMVVDRFATLDLRQLTP